MPQPSYAYACARISALEKGLLDASGIRRMADGSLEDAMRILLDARYGAMPEATSADCEKMIENERKRTAAEIRSLSPEPALTDLLLLQTDAQNLKILVKERMVQSAGVPLQEGGLYSFDQLRECVKNADYRILPPLMAEGLDRMEARLKMRPEPQLVSVSVDYAYLHHALQEARASKSPFVRDYFEALCDFDNLLTFLRLRAMGAPREEMKELLLPEGDISGKALLDAYELSCDSLNRILGQSDAREAIVLGLNEMQRTGSIGALEKQRDDYLLSLVKLHKHDTETIFPVVGYYLARDREARAVRLILTVKRNGLPDSVIGERLRELYG